MSKEGTVFPGEKQMSTGSLPLIPRGAAPPHLFPCAVHDLLWDGVDLVMHLHSAPLPIPHTHQQDPEIGAPKVQGQEVTFLWKINPGRQ